MTVFRSLAPRRATLSPLELQPVARRSMGHRLWLTAVTVLVAGIGMAYSISWPAVVRHHGFYWLTPPDFWSTVRSAHFVGWGGLPYVYNRHSGPGLITLPGFEILLAPLAMLSSALGLSESAPTILLPKPEAWLLLGPFCMLLAGGCLVFAADALARRLGIGEPRRRLLAVLVAASQVPTVVMWGHPEDALALAAAIGALVLCLDRRWTGAGWLLGVALALQLYTVLLIPLVAGFVGVRAGASVLWRAALVPGCLFLAIALPDHQAIYVLSKQPAFPKLNHPTPWILLSPKLASGVVAGGPARLVGSVVALACGWWGHRWRHDLRRVVWLAAVVMAVRCLCEAVVVPYYVMPVVVLALVAAWPAGGWTLIGAVATGMALSIMPFSHAGMWSWWTEVAVISAGALLVSRPPKTSGSLRRMVWLARPVSAPAGAQSEPALLPISASGQRP